MIVDALAAVDFVTLASLRTAGYVRPSTRIPEAPASRDAELVGLVGLRGACARRCRPDRRPVLGQLGALGGALDVVECDEVALTPRAEHDGGERDDASSSTSARLRVAYAREIGEIRNGGSRGLHCCHLGEARARPTRCDGLDTRVTARRDTITSAPKTTALRRSCSVRSRRARVGSGVRSSSSSCAGESFAAQRDDSSTRR